MEQELEEFIMSLFSAICVFFALTVIGILEEILYRLKRKLKKMRIK